MNHHQSAASIPIVADGVYSLESVAASLDTDKRAFRERWINTKKIRATKNGKSYLIRGQAIIDALIAEEKSSSDGPKSEATVASKPARNNPTLRIDMKRKT